MQKRACPTVAEWKAHHTAFVMSKGANAHVVSTNSALQTPGDASGLGKLVFCPEEASIGELEYATNMNSFHKGCACCFSQPEPIYMRN